MIVTSRTRELSKTRRFGGVLCHGKAALLCLSLSLVGAGGCASSPPAPAPATKFSPQADTEMNDNLPMAIVYERRLRNEDIFLDYFLVKVDGQPWGDTPNAGRHVVQIEARFGKLQEQQGIVVKKSAVVEVKDGRSVRVHFVVKDGEGERLSSQVDADIFVKVAEAEPMVAADPLPQDGPVAKEMKKVPIGFAPEVVSSLRGRHNLLRLCVTARGAVDFVQVLLPLHPSFDGALVDITSRWAYKPMEKDGKPIPFCYVQKSVMPSG